MSPAIPIWLAIALDALAIAVFATAFFTRRFAEGPLGPLPGGALRSGPLPSPLKEIPPDRGAIWFFRMDARAPA